MSLIGVIKSYNGMKGFGFISGEEVSGDVFFSRKDLPSDASDVQGKFLQGRLVSFDATEQPDGKLKADVMHIAPVKGQPVPGVVKSYSEKNGYGFLTTSLLTEDVHFQRVDLPPAAHGGMLPIGSKMIFDVIPRPDGKLTAKNLKFQMAEGGILPMMSDGKCDIAMQGCVSGMDGMGSWMGGCVNSAGLASHGEEVGEMEGTIKSFSEKNGYGFILVPGQMTDIKFGARDLHGLSHLPAGTPVRFQGVALEDGRIQARDILPVQGVKRFAEPASRKAGSVVDEGNIIRPTSAKKHQAEFEWGGLDQF